MSITIHKPTYDADGDYIVRSDREALAACHAALQSVQALARIYGSDPSQAARQMEQAARFALDAIRDEQARELALQ